MVYAEEIEGAVLGACLLERSAQAVVLKSLRAEMFYLTAHRVVFEAINALYARGGGGYADGDRGAACSGTAG